MAKKKRKCDTCKGMKEERRSGRQVCLTRRMTVTNRPILECDKYDRDRNKRSPNPEDDVAKPVKVGEKVKCAACQQETPYTGEESVDEQLCPDCNDALTKPPAGAEDSTDDAPKGED